jgi:hypothetical protein
MSPFEEALDDLINKYLGDMDEIISVLELKVMALKEEQRHANDGDREGA